MGYFGSTRTRTTEKLIGYVGVDSGSIVIGDPCYLVGDKRRPDHGPDWIDMVERMFDDEGRSLKGEAGTTALEIEHTLITGTPHGDGQYPVYAEVDENGQVYEMRISFHEEEDEEDEDCGSCGEHIDDCTCYDDDEEDDGYEDRDRRVLD